MTLISVRLSRTSKLHSQEYHFGKEDDAQNEYRTRNGKQQYDSQMWTEHQQRAKTEYIETIVKRPYQNHMGKLNIKTLPTLLIFKDGKTVNRLLGFDGLSNSRNPDEFTTNSLGRFLESTGAIEYEGPESDEEGEESTSRRIVRNGMLQSRTTAYDEDI